MFSGGESSVARGMTRLALHYEGYHCNETIILEQSGDKVLSWKGCNLIRDWSSKALTYLLKMPFFAFKDSMQCKHISLRGTLWAGWSLKGRWKDGECHYINRALSTAHFTDQLPALKLVRKQRSRRKEGRTCRSHYESKLSDATGALVAAVGRLQCGTGAGRGEGSQALWPWVHPGCGLHLRRLQVEKAAYTTKWWWVRVLLISTDMNFFMQEVLDEYIRKPVIAFDFCHFKIKLVFF